MKLGLSGRLTKATIRSPLTPLFLMAAIVAGFIALMTIPREEEPQISVPMVDILVNADGLKAPDAVELVTKPLEAIVKGINGVEHVYSQTQDDRVMVTARFFVGTSEDDAILRVQAKIRANYDRIPTGIPEPLIVGRGINDVAIATLTLSPKPEAAARWTDKDLYRACRPAALRAHQGRQYRPELHLRRHGGRDPGRARPGKARAVRRDAGATRRQGDAAPIAPSSPARCVTPASSRTVAAGQTLSGVPDIGLLLITTRDGRPVYVRDVAKVVVGGAPVEHRVWTFRAGHGRDNGRARRP